MISQVRRISQLVLKREHEYIDTVGLGSVDTPAKVGNTYLCCFLVPQIKEALNSSFFIYVLFLVTFPFIGNKLSQVDLNS